MAEQVATHISRDPAIYGGKPCIGGRRIAVHDIAARWHQAESPEQIAEEFLLTCGEVYAALAYYFENRERIDSDIAEGEKLADTLRAGQPSIFEKARQRIAADVTDDPLPPG